MTGIAFGFGAALAQSLSYVLSRVFLRRTGRGAGLLLTVSHVIMGLFGLLLLPWVLPDGPILRREILGNAMAVSAFYLTGQMALFRVLRFVDASTVAPMLGLKILFLAMVGVVFLGTTLSALQWMAVLLAVSGVFLVNRSDDRLPLKGLLGVLLAVVGFSLSDLSIVRLTTAMGDAGGRGVVFATALSYLICGLVLSPTVTCFPETRRLETWLAAFPYAVCWFSAMLLLFACFDRIGAVFGNIVQSSRGLISIGLGVWISHAGHIGIEQRLSARRLLCRVLGGVAISAAIALYLQS